MSWLAGRRPVARRRRAAVLAMSGSLTALLLIPAAAAAAPSRPAAGLARLAAARPAAQAAGSARAWGEDASGQRGDGVATARSLSPVRVALPAGTTVISVATGGRHSLALTLAGQVLAWGNNSFGQLGDGTRAQSDVPVLVHLPEHSKVTAVAAGGGHSLAVTSAGQVLAWGENQYGQLGDGSTLASSVPVKVRLPKGTRVVSVAASYNCSMALTASGQVLAWGYNGSGQLGNGFHTASEIPVRVRLPAGVTARVLASGGYDGLALTSAGQLLAWGDNSHGQLGDGTRISSDRPVRVRLPKGVRVVGIGAGSQHSLALTSSGRVLAWGDNEFGQLGTGTTKGSDVPVAVQLPAGVRVIAVSAGGGFSLALTSSGDVLAWGHNEDGQLGDGTTLRSLTPVRVALPAGLAAVRLGAGPTTRHGLAIVSTRP